MGYYLVTGAAGFIGAAVAKRLVDSGHEVVTIDNLTTGFRDAIPEGVEFIEGGCQDEASILALDNRMFDAIHHIAGQSSGEISYDNPIYDLQTNTQSTLMLLKYALETGCKDFIYASSMSVYGNQPDRAISEKELPVPVSFYAAGKLASEHYLRIYQKQGIRTTALRLFNAYGPGQNLENHRQGMVSIYLAMALRQKHIEVRGSKDRFRDLVYIDDIVDAFLASMNRDGEEFLSVNIATGVRTSVEELVNRIISSLSFDVSVEYNGSTPGDMFGIYGNVDYAREMLGWASKINLATGMQSMIDWAVALEKQNR